MTNLLGKVIVIIVITATVVGVTAAKQLVRSKNTEANQGSLQNQFQRLNSYAKAAKSNGDAQSTRVFTDSVVNAFVPSGVASNILKERLFALESAEQTGVTVGITEASLARAINSFATRIAAPDFAQTSSLQIRVFRAVLHSRLPDVIAPMLAKASVTRNSAFSQITNEIGPAEATIIIAALLRTKLTDESLQVPPTEWNKTFLSRQQSQVAPQPEQFSGPPPQFAGSSEVLAVPAGQQSTYTLQALSPTEKSNELHGSPQAFQQTLRSVDALKEEIDKCVKETQTNE